MPIFDVEHEGKSYEIEANDMQHAMAALPSIQPMTNREKVADAAQGIFGGLERGVSYVGGMGGDAQALGKATGASDYLSQQFESYFPNAAKWLKDETAKTMKGPIAQGVAATGGDLPGVAQLPSSSDIQEAMGPTSTYQAKTPVGQYGGSIAEVAPAVALGGGSTLLKSVVAGGTGIGSQWLGDQYKGTAFEPWARLIGGVVGGGAAPVAGSKAIEAARNFGAARSAGAEIGDILGTGPIKAGAINRVAKSAADDSLTPQSAQNAQARLGVNDTMMMDLGRQLQGRAEAMSVIPGKAQNVVLDAVEGRTGEFGSGARGRIQSTLTNTLGPSRNVVHLMDDVDSIVQQHAKPAYDQVMADHPVVNVPESITSRPVVAQAMQRAESLAKNYGEKLSTQETKTILAGDGYHIADDVTTPAKTSLKYWDYVKKGLDQRINGMMRNGMDDLSSAEKADLGGLINAKQALVSHLDQVTNGEYAAARKIAATKPELHEAMDFGRSIFGSKLLPEEVQAQISEMSIPAQSMAQAGARREIERVLDSVRNDGAKARSFLDTNNNKQKIALLFGDDAAQQIENRVAAENTFQNSTETIARNSRTTARQQLIKDTETPSPARVDTTLTGLALKPVKAGLAYALEHGMNNTRTGISQILTAKGDQIDPIVRELLNYNARKAANSGMPVGLSASILSRALLADRQQQPAVR